jgi:hypothetical protein
MTVAGEIRLTLMFQNAWHTVRSVGRQCIQALPLVVGGIRAVRSATAHDEVVGALKTAPVKHARRNPWKVFRNPMEVASHPSLSATDKQQILETWQDDAKNLATAEAEGMVGGEPNRLTEVSNAKEKVKDVGQPESTPSRSQST